jgi:hypothetical protein
VEAVREASKPLFKHAGAKQALGGGSRKIRPCTGGAQWSI